MDSGQGYSTLWLEFKTREKGKEGGRRREKIEMVSKREIEREEGGGDRRKAKE